MTREEWLSRAQHEIHARLFKLRTPTLGVPVSHVSVGWPSRGGTSVKRRVAGQCWHGETSEDQTPHIFISPMEGDPFSVLTILVHEMIHAALPGEGHKGEFITVAKELGLTRPWTSSVAGEDLAPVLSQISDTLGEYPHSPITPSPKAAVQTTRMLKLRCAECGYVARTTQKWLEVGTPTCPCGTKMEREVAP